MKGVVLDFDTLGPQDLDTSALFSLPIEWEIYGNSSVSDVSGLIKNAHVVLTNKVVLTRENINHAKDLKFIGLFATGTNIIDLDAAAECGVSVSNAVGYGTRSVVQHTWALILALTTKLLGYSKASMNGRWQKSDSFCVIDYPVQELSGKTIGIVGAGELGRGVASVAPVFGMKVRYAALKNTKHSFQNDRIDFDDLLKESDVLSLHCPLTEDNINLIDQRELKLMKSSSILINTARGKLINEKSLHEALINREIAGAGLDVLSEEPPINGNILLDERVPNLIVTPHTAWISKESRQRLVEQVAGNIKGFLEGGKFNRVC
jgi:glycerate dehydrogenase